MTQILWRWFFLKTLGRGHIEFWIIFVIQNYFQFSIFFSQLASIVNILFTFRTSTKWSLHLGVIIIGHTTFHEKEYIYI
jgi:hypothetical protein